MSANEHDERDERGPRADDADRRHRTADAWEPVTGPEVIETTDPVITTGPRQTAAWRERPDATVVVETNRVSEPEAGRAQGVVIVPYEEKPARDHRDDDRPKGEKSGGTTSQGETSKDQKSHKKGDRDAKGEKERHGDDRDDEDEDMDQKEHREPPSMTRILLFSGIVGLVCGVAGAWGYNHFFGDESKSDDKKQESSGGKKSGGSEKAQSDTKAKSSGEALVGSHANEADFLREQLSHLTERLDALQHRLDQTRAPRDRTPPDLDALQVEMGELSRTVAEVADLPARVHRLGDRLEDVQRQLKTVKERATARAGGDLSTPVAVPDTPAQVVSSGGPDRPRRGADRFTEADAPDEAREQAIELFKLGQYQMADDVLKKLRTTQPDDARVWYFAALAHGLATGKWDGPTRQFAEQGVARERAGTPPRPAVDRALSGVTRAQGGDWLGAFRRQLDKPL